MIETFELSSHPLLGADEEKALAMRIAGGDRQAWETLVTHNLKLVQSIAKRYLRPGLDFNDLVQEGCKGLMRAAQKYDGRNRFSTYATWWIRQTIVRALPDLERAIALPAHAQDDLLHIHRFVLQQEALTGNTPTVSEIASELHKSSEYIEALMRVDSPVLSLEKPITFDADAPINLESFLEDSQQLEEEVVTNEVSTDIQRALAKLPEREEDVIRRRYGIAPYDHPQTFEVIAADYGRTKQRIQQLSYQAERKLRVLLRPLAREEELVS